MLKKLLLFTVILPLISFGQNYKFDVLTKYEHTYNNLKRETAVYCNQNDDSYFLYILNYNENYVGKIYDIKNQLIHNFKINTSKSDTNELLFDFKYSKTENHNFKKLNFSSKLNYFLEKSDDTYLYYKLTFTDKNKANVTYSLKVLPFHQNLFKVYRVACMHPHEFDENIFLDIKGLIIEAENEYNSKISNDKLLKIENVDFSLKVD